MRSILFALLWMSSTLASAQTLSPEVLLRLQEASVYWESYGQHCEGWSFPSKNEEDGTCDDGDSVLFNGLLCISGYEPGCKGVKDSQDANGQWWRSPRQVGGAYRDHNSFSRDMSVGVQLYLLKTKDLEAANRWMGWLGNNKKPLEVKVKPFGTLKLGKMTRLCHDEKDNVCLITPGIWDSLARVWQAIGLPLTGAMEKPYKEFGEIGKHASALIDKLGFDWEDIAVLELRNAKPGYALHLKGVMAYAAKRINEEAGSELYDWSPVARQLHDRQPENLFFRYLAEGPNDALAEELISRCPKEGVMAPKRQWAWERADESQAWLKSMGWDCLFLGNLLLERDRI